MTPIAFLKALNINIFYQLRGKKGQFLQLAAYSKLDI